MNFECSICKSDFKTHEELTIHRFSMQGRNGHASMGEPVAIIEKIPSVTMPPINGLSKVDNFTCKICGKGFDRKVSLASHHASAHHNRQNDPCPVCGLTVPTSSMKRHLGLHEIGCDFVLNPNSTKNGRKFLYLCSFCKRDFTSSTAVRAHVMNMHPIKAKVAEAISPEPIKEMEKSGGSNIFCPKCQTVWMCGYSRLLRCPMGCNDAVLTVANIRKLVVEEVKI